MVWRLVLTKRTGSVKVALEGMRHEYKFMSDLFMFGIYSFFAMVVALTWFEYDWPVAAPVSAVLFSSAVALARISEEVKDRFVVSTNSKRRRISSCIGGIGRGHARPRFESVEATATDFTDVERGDGKECLKACRTCGVTSLLSVAYCARCGTKFQSTEDVPSSAGWNNDQDSVVSELGSQRRSSGVDDAASKDLRRGAMALSKSLKDQLYGEENYGSHVVTPIVKRGPLMKRGKHLRKNTWNPRFFEVGNGSMTYWDRADGKLLRSFLPAPVSAAHHRNPITCCNHRLAGVGVKCEPIINDEITATAPTPHCFSLTLCSSAYHVELSAKTHSEMQAWIVAIGRNSNVSFAPDPLLKGPSASAQEGDDDDHADP